MRRARARQLESLGNWRKLKALVFAKSLGRRKKIEHETTRARSLARGAGGGGVPPPFTPRSTRMDVGAACSWRACAFVALGEPGHSRLSKLLEGLRSVGGASAERTLALALEQLEKGAHSDRAPPTDGDASVARRSLTRSCGVLVDLAWEKLHTGDWKDVDEAWRDLYVIAAMAVADARDGFAPARAAETLAALDRASLLGGPTFRDELETAIARAQEAFELQTRARKNARKRERPARPRRGLGEDADDDFVAALPPGSLGERSRWRFAETRASSSSDDDTPNSLVEPVETSSSPPRDGDGENRTRRADSASRRLERLASLRSPVSPTFDAPPSLERFLTSAMAPGAPAVIKGLARAWPAFTKWRDPTYLRAVAGARTVPVETGEHYLHETHARELVTLDAFLDEHLDREGNDAGNDNARLDDAQKKKRKMGYLAQHALLDQIPALGRDVLVPDYCALTLLERREARGEGAATRAWLGPKGTVSPTHRDPTHNLLVQVVGSKYVRLYAPSQERAMYLFADPKRANAARADPRAALEEAHARRFPEFSRAPFSDAVLEPGDALYIPPGWFHYVQSVTSSFSVSFWWT